MTEEELKVYYYWKRIFNFRQRAIADMIDKAQYNTPKAKARRLLGTREINKAWKK